MNVRDWNRAESEMLLAAAKMSGWADVAISIIDEATIHGTVARNGRAILVEYVAAAERRRAACDAPAPDEAEAK